MSIPGIGPLVAPGVLATTLPVRDHHDIDRDHGHDLANEKRGGRSRHVVFTTMIEPTVRSLLLSRIQSCL